MEKHREPTLIVFYDGWCELCRRTVRWTRRWDWLGRITFANLRDGAVVAAYGLDASRAAAAVHAYQPDRHQWYAGAQAMLELAKRVPVYWPFALVLAIGIRLGVAAPLYDWVARSRRITPVGHCEAGVCRPADAPATQVSLKGESP
ncbi:thiol-disulfide oxidoreductase DCC family protein [Alicyclobacillus kakegawensis]|uniref:thiol-disulfide oxidoreductase DCC family protein n=1 Tax=Alicyclobacillus kakegawensis TaxID=392012 RepID=UPI00082F1D84|nr:DCC1-like thiol-disulfide oxidoreductase family protein [Alicyclobacillus kakegawensis]